MSDKCIKAEHHGNCCCNCAHHIEDFHHCMTAWELRKEHGGCVCSVRKGWICMPPEFEGAAYSGWSEHGMCEIHELKVSNAEITGWRLFASPVERRVSRDTLKTRHN